MAGSDAGSGRGDDDAGSAASLDDGDFDRYLAELSAASGGGDVEGEGEGDGSAGIETGGSQERVFFRHHTTLDAVAVKQDHQLFM